jgi:drug/metabolite transporter (DMT)-like permease
VSLKRAYLQLHFAVVLLAFTAILGDLISLSASVLVWWRTLIAAIGIGIFLLVTKRLHVEWIISKKKIYWLGALVAIHWICFFGSIKLANASTALICFSTITFFTSWIEPWITGRKRETHEVVFGLMVIPGILLIAGKAEGNVLVGIYLGLLAALLVSILSSFEKKWLIELNAEHMTFMQMTGAWVTMCFWLGGEWITGHGSQFWPVGLDWVYLILLGIVCTSIAWVIATKAMLVVTAYDSLMVINLEPIYGILMALLILNDRRDLSASFYAGTAIIFATVIIHPIWQRRHDRSRNTEVH